MSIQGDAGSTPALGSKFTTMIKNKKVAFISHPIGGDPEGNIDLIIEIIRDINLTRKDVIPFAPYIPDVMALDDDNEHERARGISNALNILSSGIVDELWLCGNTISQGMQNEIELSIKLGIKIVVMNVQIASEYFKILENGK